MTYTTEHDIGTAIVGAAAEVHEVLGPGLLESAYEASLAYELMERGLTVERQVLLPVTYKGVELDCLYRLDLIVARRVLVEIKVVEQLLPVHEAQVRSYLRLSALPLALLINFHSPTLKQGIRRYRNPLAAEPSDPFPGSSGARESAPPFHFIPSPLAQGALSVVKTVIVPSTEGE
jgi:GxxExxY protein